MQGHQVLVGVWRGEGGGLDGGEGPVQVVDGVDEVFGEAGDGEVARGGDFAFRALLQVAEVGDRAEVLVLNDRRISCGARLIVVLRWNGP